MTTQDTWPSLVPGDQMQPFQDIWNGMSRRGIFPVADNTERDTTLIDWLATKGMEPPSADNPLYVHNKSLPVGAQLQSSVDGTAWVTSDVRSETVGFAVSSGSAAYSPTVNRDGRWVSLDGAVGCSGIPATTWTVVGNIPNGFRPQKYQYYATQLGGSTIVASVRVQTSGAVEVWISATTAAVLPLTAIRYKAAQ